uniref:Iron-sulfur cluster co-chaperone protein HscB n=2 Tax=Nothobranchius kadleci TaxID=1051664 RepID=A0A1A8CLN3_NOTKA
MFPLGSLRIICSPRAARLPPWTRKHGASLPNAVTLSPSMSASFHSNNPPWHSGVNFREFGKVEFYYTKTVFSSKSCCTSQIKPHCWNCKRLLEKTSTFFCKSCQAIQPPEEGTTYFKIMDCDYTFTLDTHKLQTRYLQLQRSLHPDNFSQKSVKEQGFSEHQSALVNKAYTTLLKPLSRGLYMLELEGVPLEEGTDSHADSDFLLELMEVNEALDEAQTPEEASKIGECMKGKLADLTEQIDAALHKGELHAARALLTKMKYYTNIEEKVKEKLSGFMSNI